MKKELKRFILQLVCIVVKSVARCVWYGQEPKYFQKYIKDLKYIWSVCVCVYEKRSGAAKIGFQTKIWMFVCCLQSCYLSVFVSVGEFGNNIQTPSKYKHT